MPGLNIFDFVIILVISQVQICFVSFLFFVLFFEPFLHGMRVLNCVIYDWDMNS